MSDIFISHSTRDRAIARRIKKHLESKDVSAFMAPFSVEAGKKWSSEILLGLEQAKAVLFLASRAACRSKYVNQEIGGSLLLKKQIFPLVLDMPPRQLPGWTCEFQAVNLKKSLRNLPKLLDGIVKKLKLGGTTDQLQRLLRFVWDYPIAGGVQASWAVKENAVLRGNLQQAREKPGLGVAIFAVELARRAFGRAAKDRILRCVKWGVDNTQSGPPFLMLVEKQEPITGRIDLKGDFRHTLAFSVILAMTGQYPKNLHAYVAETLDRQGADGGWRPESGEETVSEVFTAIYAIELFARCRNMPCVSHKFRDKMAAALQRGLAWLIAAAGTKRLWSSGVLTERYRWDSAFTTAWVLRRLAPLLGLQSAKWTTCARDAFKAMVRDAENEAVWAGSPPIQRFRVEARIAAATRVCMHTIRIAGPESERSAHYLSDYKTRATSILPNMADDELDLATALFLLEALYEPKAIRRAAKNLVSQPAS